MPPKPYLSLAHALASLSGRVYVPPKPRPLKSGTKKKARPK